MNKEAGHIPHRWRWFYIFIVVVIIGMAGLLALSWELYREFTTIEEGENVARVDWLPKDAAHISFHRSESYTAYEFDIPEAGFIKWTQDNSWPVSRITTKPMNILRYKVTARRKEDQPTSASITKGYSFSRELNNGGGTWVAYDENSGRAYFFTAPR